MLGILASCYKKKCFTNHWDYLQFLVREVVQRQSL